MGSRCWAGLSRPDRSNSYAWHVPRGQACTLAACWPPIRLQPSHRRPLHPKGRGKQSIRTPQRQPPRPSAVEASTAVSIPARRRHVARSTTWAVNSAKHQEAPCNCKNAVLRPLVEVLRCDGALTTASSHATMSWERSRRSWSIRFVPHWRCRLRSQFGTRTFNWARTFNHRKDLERGVACGYCLRQTCGHRRFVVNCGDVLR